MIEQEKAKELIDKFGDLAENVIDEQINLLVDWIQIDWDIREIMVSELKKIKQEITEYRLIKSKSRNKS